MPDEKSLFQTTGTPWSERASRGELDAVLTASGNAAKNLFLHHIHLFAAQQALRLLPRDGSLADFGCGTGRFVRYFSSRAAVVVGTEITYEMLQEAKRIGLPRNAETILTNGIDIPVRSGSLDLIWVCGVLRYSLNVANPVYDRIAREMFRVLKPGGHVLNLEVYVDQPASDFTRDFEAAGFTTELIRLANWHDRGVERFVQTHRLPLQLVALAGKLVARYRYHFSSPDGAGGGIRSYLFVWKKR
jgi:ubiquinone/menaquinone biosynthesis C-methylase UbiE